MNTYGTVLIRDETKQIGEREEMSMDKTIGYMAEKYWEIGINNRFRRESGEPDEFGEMFDRYRKKAAGEKQPEWYVKGAAVYYTYKDEVYVVKPGRLACSNEVFECLSDGLIESMYKLGAYDMFYSGEMD